PIGVTASKVQCSCNDTYQLVQQPGEDFPTQCVLNANNQQAGAASGGLCVGPYNFQCGGGGEWSALDETCGGRHDCGDASHEAQTYCFTRFCPEGYILCANRRCIVESLRCNHINDCGDGSDELDCATTLLGPPGTGPTGPGGGAGGSVQVPIGVCPKGSF